MHVFNPSTQEAKSGRALNSRPAWSAESSRTARATQRNPVSNKTKQKSNRLHSLEEKISKQLNINSVTWLLVTALRRSITKGTGRAKRTVEEEDAGELDVTVQARVARKAVLAKDKHQ